MSLCVWGGGGGGVREGRDVSFEALITVTTKHHLESLH